MSRSQQEPPWWSRAVGYELYVRSFADGNGDGLGDLVGARERLDHLAWLGVDAVWLTPFYPSSGLDAGYDISDHCAVDPALGTLEDFDQFVRCAHGFKMRVLIDVVANHTSSEHRWFRDALENPSGSHRSFYIWQELGAEGGVPNNWVSNFGGPAWTLDPASGEYYLHLFLPEQPDLNWREPLVGAAFREILQFWQRRGVDGFRIDVAHMLLKDQQLRDNPPARHTRREPGTVEAWDRFEHVHDLDQPETVDLYRDWREAVGSETLLLGEVYLLEPDRVARYVEDGSGLDLTFWFGPLVVEWTPESVLEALAHPELPPAERIAWVTGNHDGSRPATRLGGDDLGAGRALALFTLLCFLPGMPFLFQGDELGLVDGEVAPAEARDPIVVHGGEPDASRDGSRTPMPWAPQPGLGFTTAERAWLPFGARAAEETVAQQRDRASSWLRRYQRLIAVRKAHVENLGTTVDWLPATQEIVGFSRGPLLVVLNAGQRSAELGLPRGHWGIAFSSVDAVDPEAPLEADEARVLTACSGSLFNDQVNAIEPIQ